ncbi:hypothetical protein [Salarchaeum sp. JOR-1]|uniref:DUF7139 domain-containing protein n=1 Tax=Salarchaeum sp. JOR-1 TaxID=2599399 RepID=UPI001198BB29|nr:hypothetical protein [Salarchaeum sp. JOR-1]QDX39718.1 hypothetical protein FQU85_01960 [Salarchaeum sp. JOR-1]
MTSLADAYERQAGDVSRRRVYAGTAVFAVGALMVVVGVLAGTTPLLLGENPSMAAVVGARELAGVLVGLGLPAVFVGIVTVLPANRFQRAAAVGGAVLAAAGVFLFAATYPENWYSSPGVPSTAVFVLVVVYSVGVMTTLWCLFTAVATFKTRNDPGGTVTMTVTRDGETRTVEVPENQLDSAREALSGGSFGGVGVFGDMETPADDRPTQTPDASPSGSASDGGATTDLTSPLDDPQDKYCGSCEHFDYVRTDDGLKPYCGLHDDVMDDMEACAEWTPNN